MPSPPCTIIPCLFVAFCFEFYFLQVVHTLQSNATRKDLKHIHSDTKTDFFVARVLGFMILMVIGTIFFFIFFFAFLSTPDPNKIQGPNLTPWEIVRDTIIGVLGNNHELEQYTILKIGHLGIVLQSLLHMPFIFFIGKEHILQCYDEYKNHSLSLMVDRIKSNVTGDPRYFRAEKRFKLLGDKTDLDL